MKVILAIPVLFVKAIGEILFGDDVLTEEIRAVRTRAQIMTMTNKPF